MMEPDEIVYERLPECDRATFVLAFAGWNDAGGAATSALDQLAKQLDATEFAHLDGEGFYDYQQARPVVTITGGVVERILWPRTTFSYAERPDGSGLLLANANEPHFRWKAYCDALGRLARQLGVRRVLSLGALLADIPHTRPCSIVSTASTPELRTALGFRGADYEGPTGIVGVVNQLMAEAGFEAASIWASIPHYVSASPNPKGSLALLEALGPLLAITLDLSALQAATVEYQSQVNAAIDDNAEVKAYVEMLERRADTAVDDDAKPLVQGRIPTGDELAAELQRFLDSQDE